jgi:hypothetical protein
MAFSTKVAALAALTLSLLVTYGSCARPANFNASDFTADPNWEAARATWYGAPTGAGPYDDGKPLYMITDDCQRVRLGDPAVFMNGP